MSTTNAAEHEDLLRTDAPRVLAALVRRYGQFDACEDAVQEALIAAHEQWHRDGVPHDPHAWLISVAQRRLIDGWRSESARRRREEAVSAWNLAPVDTASTADDTLTLLFLCCHPALSVPSQLALTLRAVGGLTTAEIARAFLVPEATMAQRISRAKQSIKAAGATFTLPDEVDLPLRLRVVMHALYLTFSEGYVASAGADLHRKDLTAEGIRVARLLRAAVPDDAEVAGLLALMILTDARRVARTDANGTPVPLADQDRTHWDAGQIAEGIGLIRRTLGRGAVGPYQVQAAIAALHDEAPTVADTDWPQILALYGVLEHIAPSPIITLNRAVALGMVDGPQAALAVLATLDIEATLVRSHRLAAVRAHLHEMAGDRAAARAEFQRAATLALSVPEQRYLLLQVARLDHATQDDLLSRG